MSRNPSSCKFALAVNLTNIVAIDVFRFNANEGSINFP